MIWRPTVLRNGEEIWTQGEIPAPGDGGEVHIHIDVHPVVERTEETTFVVFVPTAPREPSPWGALWFALIALAGIVSVGIIALLVTAVVMDGLDDDDGGLPPTTDSALKDENAAYRQAIALLQQQQDIVLTPCEKDVDGYDYVRVVDFEPAPAYIFGAKPKLTFAGCVPWYSIDPSGQNVVNPPPTR